MARALHVCPEPGCVELVKAGSRYCVRHTRLSRPEDVRKSSHRRGYDRTWRRVRDAFLDAHPDCVECGAAATEVDHALALKDGGTHDWDNLRSVCKRCHSRKTAKVDGAFGNVRRTE
jgi:5-methylcytosine-specific restriction enzyme A